MQPYTNPYYFQNNPSYVQPQYGQINPYPDRLAQLQAQQQQFNQSQYGQQMPVQPIGLNGEVVDSIDVVKAKNVDMSGQPTFYPKSDLSEVYVKRLMADGTSQIVTYKAAQPEESKPVETKSYVDVQTLNAMLGQMKSEILQSVGGGLSEIKQMITPPEQPKRQRGGNQNND